MNGPHVLLLAGPGSKRLEAEALERAARVVSEGARDPDGARRRTLAREHPDLLVAAPERRRRVHAPEAGDADSKETTIPAALVRAVAADASRLPYEGALRAVLLLDVERTDSAAFSALLKVLEEPPTRTRFVLTATRPRLLPPTILSRVAFESLPGSTRAATAKALEARGVPAEEASARAAFSPTDTDEAAALDLPAARAERDAILEAALGVFETGRVSWRLALATALGAEEVAAAPARLGTLSLLLRDAVAAAVDPGGHAVVHRERWRDLARLGENDAGRLLEAAGGALDLASALLDSRRNARLAVEAFALAIR